MTVHAPARECKQSSAPGESPVKLFSDRGSIPLSSTTTILHKTLLLCRRLCRDGLAVIGKCPENVNVLWVFSAFIEALYSEDVIIFGVFLFSDIPQTFPHIYVHPVYLLVYSAQSILHKKYILRIFFITGNYFPNSYSI